MTKILWALLLVLASAASAASDSVELRGRYSFFRPPNPHASTSESFQTCNSKDFFWVVGAETLLAPLRASADKRSRTLGSWMPIYVDVAAVAEDKSKYRDAASYIGVYRFTKVMRVSEAIPEDCGYPPWYEKALGDFLFPGRSPIDVSQFRTATQQELDLLRQQADWPFVGLYCGGYVPTTRDLRAFDLSGDGQMDFIFTTYCGQEDPLNHIWVHHGATIRFLGVVEGKLQAFHGLQPGSFSVRLDRGWCCASWQGSVDVYDFKASKGFKLVRSSLVLNHTRLVVPTKRMSPVSFVVSKDNYELRSEPEVDDVTVDELTEVAGNVFARFKAGSAGRAYAQRKDAAGEVWWFVIMEARAKTIGAEQFYDHKGDGERAGWMIARFLSPTRQ